MENNAEYRKEIDGLRALAVLSVIICHAGFNWLPGGFAGVDVFFVISGFLITKIILQKITTGNFSFKDFYVKRAKRILPALFFMLSIVSLLTWISPLPSQIQTVSGSVFFSVLSLSNFYFIDFVDYFAPSSDNIMLLHTWSLGIEEQFYILFPLLALTAYFFFKRQGILIIIIVLACISFALSEWGWRNEPRANYFFSPSRFWEILIGGVAAFWRSELKTLGNELIAALGLCALLLTFFTYDKDIIFPSFYTLAPTVGTVLILISSGMTITVRILRFAPFRLIGLISYSAYLWHQPVFVFARLEGYQVSEVIIGISLIILTLLVSYLSWYFIEQPFRNSKQFSYLKSGPILCAIGTLLLVTSVAGYFTTLPLNRFNKPDYELLKITQQDAKEYQRGIDKNLRRRPFSSNDNKPYVAIVGDSYARDFMNILNEKGILDSIDASVWPISDKCAPFFLGNTDNNLKHIWNQSDCVKYDRYKTAEMLSNISFADVIVLASRWHSWQTPYIAETIKNISEISDASILLVGTKDFGQVKIKSILKTPFLERASLLSAPNEELVFTNNLIKELQGITFIDVINSICEVNGRCPLVTPDGALISVDGSHLTKSGAIFLGKSIAKYYNLEILLGL